MKGIGIVILLRNLGAAVALAAAEQRGYERGDSDGYSLGSFAWSDP